MIWKLCVCPERAKFDLASTVFGLYTKLMDSRRSERWLSYTLCKDASTRRSIKHCILKL